MAARILPTPEQLRELLRYEPDTGKLFWRQRPREMFNSDRSAATWNKRFAGQQAFATKHRRGYLCGVVSYEKVLAHRAAWALHHGEWPAEQIDHVNGIKTDNRIANLRAATHAENLHNMRAHTGNPSKLKGVTFDKARGRWMARIMTDRKELNLGRFDTPEEAHAAYCAAAQKHHGEFAKTQ